MQNETAKTNLLIDSLSDDSDDVPDLQLIPPVKMKKKKIRKVVPKWPTRGTLEEEFSSSNESQKRFCVSCRCWLCSLSFVLFSFFLGSAFCAVLCFRLLNEVESLKFTLNVTTTEYRANVLNLEDKISFLLSNVADTSFSSNLAASNTTKDEILDTAAVDALRTKLASSLSELEKYKQQLQNFNNFSSTVDATIQELKSNFSSILDICKKTCYASSAATDNSTSPLFDKSRP